MTISRLLLPALLAASALGAEPASSPLPEPAQELRGAVWAAVRSPDEPACAKALEILRARADASIQAVEQALREGPPRPAETLKGPLEDFAAESENYGRARLKITSEIPVTCEHVNYTSTFLLYVPTSYDPAKPHPLCVVFMGGSSTKTVDEARTITGLYLQPWIPLAEKRGWIVAAPVTTRGWGALGRSLTRSTIHEVMRRYHVDPDRVFGWGQSMGANACWREGLLTPDEWAGIAPVCGGADYGDGWKNLNRLFVYQVWGDGDPHSAGFPAINRKIAQDMKRFGIACVSVPKSGGHELYEEEIPAILEAFSAHPRDLFPRRIDAAANAPWLDQPDGPMPDWKEQYRWTKPMPFARFYWTQMFERMDDAKIAGWTAEVKEGNRIEVSTDNVKTLRLFLHDRLLDLGKGVTVVLNGKTVFEGKVERSLKVMIDEVRASGDPGRAFQAVLDLHPEPPAPAPAP